MDEDNLYMGLVGLYEKYSTFLPTRDSVSTKNYRYISYRHFTWWVHNKLKKHVRRRLPACALRVIRERFPAPDGIYVGFKHGKVIAESMATWKIEGEKEHYESEDEGEDSEDSD